MDTLLVKKKLGELEKYVHALEGLKSYSLQELRMDMAKAWSVEYGLQLTIQVVLDIGSHILAAVESRRSKIMWTSSTSLGKETFCPRPL